VATTRIVFARVDRFCGMVVRYGTIASGRMRLTPLTQERISSASSPTRTRALVRRRRPDWTLVPHLTHSTAPSGSGAWQAGQGNVPVGRASLARLASSAASSSSLNSPDGAWLGSGAGFGSGGAATTKLLPHFGHRAARPTSSLGARTRAEQWGQAVETVGAAISSPRRPKPRPKGKHRRSESTTPKRVWAWHPLFTGQVQGCHAQAQLGRALPNRHSLYPSVPGPRNRPPAQDSPHSGALSPAV